VEGRLSSTNEIRSSSAGCWTKIVLKEEELLEDAGSEEPSS
jgi:hypothetical protein